MRERARNRGHGSGAQRPPAPGRAPDPQEDQLIRKSLKLATVTVLSAGSLAVGAVGAVAPAQAANNTGQAGLVNLALTDTTVQVPVAVAANICGVAVNVLAAGTAQGPVDCRATGTSTATRSGGGGNNNTSQNGLVNVAVTDTTVQVPIGIAANVCGITVNALSALTAVGPVTCRSGVVATATR